MIFVKHLFPVKQIYKQKKLMKKKMKYIIELSFIKTKCNKETK